MTLNIVDASEVKVEALAVMVYGPPGVGKTSLALTGNAPILFDFDRGVHRAEGRKGKKCVRVSTWEDVEGWNDADLKPFSTVILDTIGTCLDRMASDIIRVNPKMGRGGGLTLPGYGELKKRFRGWLSHIRESGKHVVFISHVEESEKEGEVVDRIVATGGSKLEVLQQSDLIGKLVTRQNKRYLTFDPTEIGYGKNVGLKPRWVPPPNVEPHSMQKIMDEAMASINEEAAASDEEQDAVADMRKRFGILGAQGLTVEAEKMIKEKAPVHHKKILMDVATESGFKWDKEGGRFYAVHPEGDGGGAGESNATANEHEAPEKGQEEAGTGGPEPQPADQGTLPGAEPSKDQGEAVPW